MKQKYYLRGLGIGILITALVFIVAGPSELSDAEIIQRAEELGYVKAQEQTTPSIGLKDLLENGTPTPTATVVPEHTPEPTATVTPEPTTTATVTPVPTQAEDPTEAPTEVPEATATPMPTETPTPEPTATPMPTATPTPEPTATVTPTPAPQKEVVTATIVVERGNTATVVCNKIEAAGILENGSVLRNYLVNNNLTDFINVGTYTLSSDMSVEEIADIITGR